MDQDFKDRFARQLGNNLRIARQSRMMRIEELANVSSILARRLSDYEKGQGRITVDELECVAFVVRLPLSHFFTACVLCGGKHCTGS